MVDSSGTVIESQVDWLTVSAHGAEAADRLLDLARYLAEEQRGLGNRERRWRLQGYEGSHVGAVEYGSRDAQSGILRLIGDAAAVHLTKALSVADTVTRLDLAVTWRAEPPDPLVGRNTYAQAELFRQLHPKSARPSFVGDADGGYTCYVGQRESANMLRVYNKGAECLSTNDHEGYERYRSCWRYELETKAGVAAAVAAAVGDTEDRPAYVARYVHAYAEAHGISPMFLVDKPMALLPGFRRRADADSRLAHLARNVRPTVDWLRSSGYEDKVRETLGFGQNDASLRELQGILDRYSGTVPICSAETERRSGDDLV